jgi:hypothetical protein
MDDLEEARLRVIAHTVRCDHAVVPVIAANQSVTVVRIRRPCGQHRAVALGLNDGERALFAPAEDLERLTTAHEIVLHRIEREQDADATLEVGVQDDHVAIPIGTREEAHPVTLVVVAIPVEPDLDGWIR